MKHEPITISRILQEAFQKYGDEIAIRRSNDSRQLKYHELYETAGRVAALIEGNGVEAGKGHRVAILMGRTPNYIVVLVACLLFGYTAVLLDTEYPEERRNYILKDSEPKFVFDEEALAAAAQYEPLKAVPVLATDTEATIVYTSGSTGNPKGVIHTQESAGKTVLRMGAEMQLTTKDIHSATGRFTFVAHYVDWLIPLCSGSSVLMVPFQVAKDPQQLALFHKINHITSSIISPQILKNYKRTAESLRLVVTGSEKVSNVHPDGMRVINAYGMSECCFVMTKDIVEYSDQAYLGKPIGDVAAYVLDPEGNEVEEGELCLAGVFFSGYLHLPERTRKTIVDNPFRDSDGHLHLVHTGDCVKKLPDGSYLYKNRLDWMVKINGQRVEPGEIENVIKEIDGIKDVAVKSFSDSKDRVYLCAYYIPKAEAMLSVQSMKKKIAEKLPSYMVPAFFVQLDAFPLNANGKLDRLSLKQPDISAFQKQYVTPETEEEKLLCHTMEQVLGLTQIGANDDFFDLGGDSVRSAEMATLLGENGVTVALIYEGRSPRGIAQLMRDRKKVVRTPEMAEKARKKSFSLLPYQTYYLDYQMYSPKKILATNPLYCKLPAGTVTPEELKTAAETVFRHFAVFGTVFSFAENGELVQHYVPELVPEIAITHVTEEAFEAEVKPNFLRPFKMLNRLLWRAEIFVTPENTYLLIDIHHAISDGTMIMNMMRNIFRVLAGEAPEEDYYYLYLQEWEEKRSASAAKMEEASRFVDGAAAFDGYPQPDFESINNIQGTYFVDTEYTLRQLTEVSEAHHISLGNLFVAAAAEAIGKYNQSTRVGVRWTYNGRDEAWKKNLVGLLLTSVSTDLDFQESDTREKIVAEVKRQAELGIRHNEVLSALKDMSPGLSERTDIVYQHGIDLPANMPKGAEIQAYFDYHNATLCLLNIIINEKSVDEPLAVKYVFNSSRYTEESIRRYHALFSECLRAYFS